MQNGARRVLPLPLTLPLLALPLCTTFAVAQGRGAPQREASFNISSNPLLSSFRFRSIGPASMGGRIDDIEVAPSDPNTIYLGYAVGGVFKSVNNGVSFEPVFQTYTTASIGDIAIHPTNPDIVYVGTGEPNNRQTSSFGDGIYKTTDGGKTFTHIGLKETQTIARIVIDPKNPEVLYVASPGHLFGPNPERGVFKTTDGGKTWNKIKYVDENTGFTDIAIDPSNTNILYAASYQRRRTSCCFNGGGEGSALWKTEDGGKTWAKLTGNGLPPGTYGRIALGVSASNPNIVYAQIEAGETGTPDRGRGGRGAAVEETPPGAAAAAAGRAGGAAGAGRGGQGGGRGVDPSTGYCNNGAPVAAGQQPPQLPAPDPKLGGVFRSDNKGRSWTFVSNCNSRPMYFSQLRVDPQNPNTIYVAGLPVAKSLDGGKTFATLDAAGGNASPGHVDQHAIWVDPKNSNHLMIGNDGGLDISYDQGRTWDFVNTMATGLAYVVTADYERPYNVYTGLQDNNSWGGPSSKRGRGGITNMDWFALCGGDGFHTAVNWDHPNIVYCESQNGNTSRYDFNTGQQQSIRPSAGQGPQLAGQPAGGGGGGFGGGRGGAGRKTVVNADPGEAYRFNWNTPFILSPHNPDIVYLGGNRLFKSYDRGSNWVASPDLTKKMDRRTISVMGVGGDKTQLSKNDGLSQYSTIITVAESPVMPGVVWAGTDDGNVQVSRDGGLTFAEVGKNITGLPANALGGDSPYWISRIDASHFDPGTAYVAIDGHRTDDLRPYVFVTRNYGQSFENITNDLPGYGNVQVVREDPKNKDLLYVGTEFGLYISLNGGKHWEKFMNDYPTVRTDDIMIHPRDGDLIVATHGRSIFIADDITPLEQLTPTALAEDAYLFDLRTTVAWITDYTNGPQIGGQKNFVGRNAPAGAAINYYLKSAATGDVRVSVSDASGRVVANIDAPKNAGINRVQWPQQAVGGRGGGGGGGGVPNVDPATIANMTQAQRDSLAAAFGFGGGGRGGGPALQPGMYTVKLSVNGKEYSKQLQVLEDKWFKAR